MSPQVQRSTRLVCRLGGRLSGRLGGRLSGRLSGRLANGCGARHRLHTSASASSGRSSHGNCRTSSTDESATTPPLSGRSTSVSRWPRLRTHQPRPDLSPSPLPYRSQARRFIQSPSSTSCACRLLSTPCLPAYACFSAAAVHPSSPKSQSLSQLASSSSRPDRILASAAAPRVLLRLAPVRSRISIRPSIMGSALEQTRHHGHDHGHGHSGLGHHHHHHDNTYLTSTNTSDPGVRITRLGLLSNLGMAIAKFVGGWAFNSRAMIADAWHSLADLASDVLTLLTVSWSLKPPNHRFPMGFGKVESLGSLGVSGMLLVGGLYMGWESGISLYGHFNPEGAHHIFEHVGHGHSHSHSPADLGIPSIHALWLAAGTILIKEWLYHATMKVARERKSSVLASNAVHHRVDSLTGIVTLAAVVGANMFENAAWLDPVGGLFISIMVVGAGFENTRAALYELADRSLDDEVKKSVRKQAQRALAIVSEGHEAELRDISGIKSGQNYLVDVELAVPGAWTVDETKDLEDAVRSQIGSKVRGVRRLRVRFVSRDKPVDEKWDEFIAGSEALQKPEGHAEEEEGDSTGEIKDEKHRH
ncbi:hypothetical protein E4U41_000319 [Claviceps citrina]|nr:hypothetical protein E4U41_000319 [Claviceps citrina]